MMHAVRRAILHVDMDAFYASVEQRDDPVLRGKPLVVGGSARRGVVLAASYAVRPFGIRSAMPMARALRLCPDLLVVPPRFDRYSEVSDEVFRIFHAFTPEVEGLSLDEAFLDVTRSVALHGAPIDQARRIKERIRDQALRVASRLRRAGLRARSVHLKVKFADFRIATRQETLPEPTDDGAEIYAMARRLLGKVEARPARLTGVHAGDLGGRPQMG